VVEGVTVEWRREVDVAAGTKQQPSFARALYRNFKVDIWITGIFTVAEVRLMACAVADQVSFACRLIGK
jgi:hypothetical protein